LWVKLFVPVEALDDPFGAYRQALDDFFRWCEAEAAGGFTKATANAYRPSLEARGLSPSTLNPKAFSHSQAVEPADNGFMPPELAAAISRVKGAKRNRIRTAQWLMREQAEGLISAPNAATIKGKRVRALLAVLVGLAVEHIQLRDAHWVIVDLISKGERVRTQGMSR